MKKIILARHGEGEGGARKLVQSAKDLLTDKGIQQAQELADYLKEKNIQCIVTSPSFRTLQTSTIVASVLKIPISIMDEFLEINFGTMIGQPSEGLTIEKAMALGGAEHPQQVFDRVKSGWNKIGELPCEGAILVVSHRSILSAIEAIRSGGSVEDFLKNRQSNEGLAFGYWKEIEIVVNISHSLH